MRQVKTGGDKLMDIFGFNFDNTCLVATKDNNGQWNYPVKVTSSLRKELSRKLYTDYGIRKPAKFKGLVAVVQNLEIKIRWQLDTNEYETVDGNSWDSVIIDNIPKNYFYPEITIREIKDHPSDEYHPLHSWYSRGANDGYGDGYWDRSEDADYSEPPEFPSEEARAAYQLGYDNGHANGVMDE